MIYFLLPAYNESASIAAQLQTIHDGMAKRNAAYKIFVVEDGSKDRTLEVLRSCEKKFPLTILRHEMNQGVGQAFRTGFGALFPLLQSEDCVVTMDADNTHKMKTVDLMLARIEDGYEVVIGSMFTTGGMMVGAPFHRYVLSVACNLIYRVAFHVKGIREFTGFFRAYSASALLRLHQVYGEKLITANGFACMAEFLVKCRRVACLMTEVPMIVRYDEKASASALRVFPTIGSHLQIIAQNLFARNII